ncbi:MAG: hypothetical protein AAF252_00465 [Pseudomonadota bacterium]
MSVLDRIEIICGDVRDVAADVLVMKYANGLYGADLAVADRLSIDFHITKGQTKYFEGRFRALPDRPFAADWVLFFGVGGLFEFRYQQIRAFSAAILTELRANRPDARIVATTIHGPGYGLDEREAFTSQLLGYLDVKGEELPTFEKLLIVERDEQRAFRLGSILEDMKRPENEFADLLTQNFGGQPDPSSPERVGSDPFTRLAEDAFSLPPPAPAPAPLPVEKPKLFAAMPFAEKYMDEYDIAFVEAAHEHGFICERLDLESYVGDVIDEIFKRIRDSSGVIALLNDNNPNVFLEVGYAMASNTPVILIAHKDHDVAFDLKSQNRQTYGRIAELRRDLTKLIGDLKQQGTLV